MNTTSHIAVVVCRHVLDGTHPVLLVSKIDGEWQFLCGASHQGTADYRLVGIGHVVERDPTLNEILDLPDNWDAERNNVSATWRRLPSQENE